MTNQTPTVANGTDTAPDELFTETDGPLLLTIAEVAEKLRVKPWSVYKLCDDGILPCVYMGPKTRRVKPDDLRAYVASLPSSRPEPKSATA